MFWYKAECKNCHLKPGMNLNQTIYIYDRDIMAAIRKFRRQGAVPHDKLPNIRLLSTEESSKLEDYALREFGLSAFDARRRCIRFQSERPPV